MKRLFSSLVSLALIFSIAFWLTGENRAGAATSGDPPDTIAVTVKPGENEAKLGKDILNLDGVIPTITRYPENTSIDNVHSSEEGVSLVNGKDFTIAPYLSEGRLKPRTHVDYLLFNPDPDSDIEPYKGKTKRGLYKIELKIPFNPDLEPDREYFNNQASLVDLGNSSEAISSKAFYFTDKKYMLSNGFKQATYDFENRQINWEVGFNYNIRSLTGAVITDTFADDNHELILNPTSDDFSFKLYH